MNYKEVICKFCKECTGEKINVKIIKTDSKVNSDITVYKCENIQPKEEYEGNIG